MKKAVIGIGSNSVRMLAVSMENGGAYQLKRDREGTRLFAGLDEHGNLSAESMNKTIAAVTRMAADARALGADEVHLFATSASRDAANGAEFAARLRETGLELEIISGSEEAELSFLGATGGGLCGVIDIGGGSTEIVVGQGTELSTAFSCQMGAVRLFRKLPIACRDDLPRVEALALSILEDKLREQPDMVIPAQWVGTGGTFTTLAAMVRGIPWTERTFMHGTVMELDSIAAIARKLADMTLEERLTLPGLQPHRADIVVHGICILTAVMKRLGIESIRVSEYGNMDGYMKRRYGISGEIVRRG